MSALGGGRSPAGRLVRVHRYQLTRCWKSPAGTWTAARSHLPVGFRLIPKPQHKHTSRSFSHKHTVTSGCFTSQTFSSVFPHSSSPSSTSLRVISALVGRSRGGIKGNTDTDSSSERLKQPSLLGWIYTPASCRSYVRILRLSPCFPAQTRTRLKRVCAFV